MPYFGHVIVCVLSEGKSIKTKNYKQLSLKFNKVVYRYTRVKIVFITMIYFDKSSFLNTEARSDTSSNVLATAEMDVTQSPPELGLLSSKFKSLNSS